MTRLEQCRSHADFPAQTDKHYSDHEGRDAQGKVTGQHLGDADQTNHHERAIGQPVCFHLSP